MSEVPVAGPQREDYQFSMRARTVSGLIAGLLLMIAQAPASAAIGEWVADDVVQLRVVASVDDAGNPAAALEVRLEPGWKTYWRTPGEGGLPTVFDFGASRNLAVADASYPAPRRYDDGYSVTNTYEGRVLFPIEFEAALSSAPVTLDIQVNMGVCEEICIPMQVHASVTLAPGEIDPDALAIVEEARGLLPGAPESGTFEIKGVDLGEANDGDTAITVTAIVPQAFGAELFVEGPVGWYQSAAHQTARDGNQLTFEFVMWTTGDGAALAGAPLTFTLVSAGAAIEQTIPLP